MRPDVLAGHRDDPSHTPGSPSLYILVQSQAPPNLLSYDPLVFRSVISPHFRRLHIRGTLIIRFREHAHDGYQDLFHTLDGAPPLVRVLVVIRVFARGV